MNYFQTKHLGVIFLIGYLPCGYAVTSLKLHHQSLSALQQFEIKTLANKQIAMSKTQKKAGLRTRVATQLTLKENQLEQLSFTLQKNISLARYQQYFKGLPVVGGQITISANSDVNGKLFKAINLDTRPTLDKTTIIDKARSYYPAFMPISIDAISTQLQVRILAQNEARLTYQVSSKFTDQNNKPSEPILIIDANSGELLQQWNNIQHYEDIGPGGNAKGQEYWYGQDGLPPLMVQKQDSICTMENANVKLVNLHSLWDWSNFQTTPYEYTCGQNSEDEVNGAFSPMNDAYVFGGIIVDMYQQWYGLHALQYDNGLKMQLIMRVHFGEYFDNAFWDGQTMSFGDGDDFYPLVSLDVASHEVSHGFTQQHASLEYHDQSGALNESFSDMAGITAIAYLQKQQPQLHQKVYSSTTINWGIGTTITKNDGAMRYMHQPSNDGRSADCFDKKIAKQAGQQCVIDYQDILEAAQANYQSKERQQNFIVHTASGIFNKAFYLMAQQYGIKASFQIMLQANIKYWTPSTTFQSAACDIIQATTDVGQDAQLTSNIMNQIGIKTDNCQPVAPTTSR